jgi:hypothetical protein
MKKILLVFIIVAAGTACMFTSDSHSGPMQKETRVVTGFEGIRVGGAFEVTLTQSETYSLVVDAQSTLLPKIKTDVKGGVLEISTSGDISTDSAIRITIGLPNLKSVEGSGASRVLCTNRFRSPSLRIKSSGADVMRLETASKKIEVTLSGAGSITLSGSSEELEADLSGAGDLEALHLETNKTEVFVSGAGHAKVNARSSLSGKVDGAGSITYSGDPSDKFIETNGVGSIIHAGTH